MMSLVMVAGLCFSHVANQVANAQDVGIASQSPLYDGKYVQTGAKSTRFQGTTQKGISAGETNKQRFCESRLLSTGSSGATDTALGVALILLLLYMFLGVAVASDIFMEAIAKITSLTKQVEVKELNGKSKMVDVPVWNPRVANVVLLALGSAAPEIFLSFFSTVTNIETVPNALGPMVLIGSASFNLLMVTGISIMAVSEIKKVANLNVFLVTFAFATFAFVWLFLVLVVFSPAYIEFWEAMTTLAFYPLLLFFVWATEKCSPEGKSEAEQLERNRRVICKQALRDLAEAHGKMYVMDAVTNNSGAPEDVGRIHEYFKTCLGVKSLSNVEIDQLLQVLEAENPIERLAFRPGSASTFSAKVSDFTSQAAKEARRNAVIGFKHSNYSVFQGHATIVVEKQTQEDASFWVQTIDDSATSPKDFETMRMMFTMKANEMQREIYVKINEDSQRQASQFKVVLLSESERSQLEGIDSSTTITITNNADDVVAATEFKKDAVVEIALEEKDEKVLALRARLERVLNQPTELTYSQQFKQATMLTSENAEEVSAYEGFVQYISMPWKLLFACIPPSSYMGGWLRFACAFVAIGLVSFLVLEVTTTVGCMFDMRSAVQALVLVAIGTSLPDLTASRRAAESRRTKDADASIATLAGANAASVFIGLGLPWTIATLYHWANYGESFFVGKLPTADITFALVLFLACSVICFIVLALRRLIIGGELGGPGVSRVFSAIVMFFLWGAFITLNIMNSYGYLGARDIFVPSVAINANQHRESDWTAAQRPVVSKVANNDIKVEWTLPAENQFCRVEFKSDLSNRWLQNSLCPCDGSKLTRQACTISMAKLAQDNNLNRCQQIKVRIMTVSSSSNGSFGTPIETTSNIKVTSGCSNALVLNSVGPSFNKLTWNALDSSCYSGINNGNFQMQARQQNSGFTSYQDFNMNPSSFNSDFSSYTVSGSNSVCGKLDVRMRVTTPSCLSGGTWSQPATLNVPCGGPTSTGGVVMGKPAVSLSTGVVDCKVIIEWNPPTGVAVGQVERYIVRAKNVTGQKQEIVECRGQIRRCEVPMSTFTNKSPYFLNYGDTLSITIAVMTKNSNLFSSDSLPNTDKLVTRCTQPVARIQNFFVRANCDQISANWSGIANAAAYSVKIRDRNGQWQRACRSNAGSNFCSFTRQSLSSFQFNDVNGFNQFQVEALLANGDTITGATATGNFSIPRTGCVVQPSISNLRCGRSSVDEVQIVWNGTNNNSRYIITQQGGRTQQQAHRTGFAQQEYTFRRSTTNPLLGDTFLFSVTPESSSGNRGGQLQIQCSYQRPVAVCNKPQQMQTRLSQYGCGDIALEWFNTRDTVRVTMAKGNGAAQVNVCTNIPVGSRGCIITKNLIDQLRLQAGERITVTTVASNNCGTGVPQTQTYTGGFNTGVAPNRPVVTVSGNTLQWSKDSNAESYLIQSRPAGNTFSPWNTVIQSLQPNRFGGVESYTQTTTGTCYQVTARGKCSTQSQPSAVQCTSVPTRAPGPIVVRSATRCNSVTFTWGPPSDRGTGTISSYRIEIRPSSSATFNRNWVQVPNCSGTNNNGGFGQFSCATNAQEISRITGSAATSSYEVRGIAITSTNGEGAIGTSPNFTLSSGSSAVRPQLRRDSVGQVQAGGSFTVRWNPVAGQNYQVYVDSNSNARGSQDVTTQVFNAVNLNGGFYRVNVNSGATFYRVQISASDAQGCSTIRSNVIEVAIASLSPPGVPQHYVDVENCSLRINWNEAPSTSTPVTQYTVQLASQAQFNGQPTNWVTLLNCNIRSLSNANIARGDGRIYKYQCVVTKQEIANLITRSGRATPYFVAQVQATNSAGNGGWSTQSSTNTNLSLPSGPAAVSNFAVSRINANELNLSWNNNAAGVTYRIEVDNGSGFRPINNGQNINQGQNSLRYTLPAGSTSRSIAFQIMAVSSCGNSSWAQTQFVRQLPPNPPQLSMVQRQCNVDFTWTQPVSNGSTIDRYNISISSSRNNGGTQIPLNQYGNCRQALSAANLSLRTCTIPMADLMQSPFFLTTNDFIQGQATACSGSLCSSATTTTSSFRLVSQPQQVQNLQLVKTTGNRITATWNAVGNAVIGSSTFGSGSIYTATCSSRVNGVWVDQPSTQRTSLSRDCIENANATSYRITVKASNACGAGVAATAIYSPPRKPNAPAIQVVTSCKDLRFTWNTPTSNGTPITRYELSLMNNLNVPTSINSFCPATRVNSGTGFNTAANSCTIPLAQLGNWNLTSGTAIRATIAACSNALCSEFANSNSAVLPAAPAGISRPQETGRVGGNIQISWNRVNSGFNTGAVVAAQSYQVQYADNCNNGNANTCNWINSGAITSANTASVNINSSSGQCFRVTSSSGCGNVTSPPMCITFAVAPGIPSVSTRLEGCDQVRISWNAPAAVANAGAITAYNINIQGRDGRWSSPQTAAGGFGNNNNLCGGNVNTFGGSAQFSCVVSFATLQRSPYNLAVGSPVKVQASATNATGNSGFADNRLTEVSIANTSVARLAQPQVRLDSARNCVNVTWGTTTSGSSVTYELQYSTSNGIFQNVNFASGSGTNGNHCYSLANAGNSNCGISIGFRVRARGCSVGQWSDVATYSTTAPAVPRVTRPQAVLDSARNCVNVTWGTSSTGQALTYELEYRTGTFGYRAVNFNNGSSNTGSHCYSLGTTGNCGTSVTFRVRARGCTVGQWSDETTYSTTSPAVPRLARPQVLLNSARNCVNVTWNNTNAGAVTYELQYSAGNGVYQNVNFLNGSNNNGSHCYSLANSGNCGTSVSFRVRARGCTVGQWSDVATYTTTAAPVARVARPTTQLDTRRNCVNVSWGNNNSGAVTYELEYSTGNSQYQAVNFNNGARNTGSFCYPLNNLRTLNSCSVSINFRVRARGCSVGQWSDIANYTSVSSPGAPSIQANAVGCNAQLRWQQGSCPTGNLGFNVEIQSNNGWQRLPTCGTTNTSSGFGNNNSCILTRAQLARFGTVNNLGYVFRVSYRQANGANSGLSSGPTRGITLSTGPPAFTQPIRFTNRGNTINLSWEGGFASTLYWDQGLNNGAAFTQYRGNNGSFNNQNSASIPVGNSRIYRFYVQRTSSCGNTRSATLEVRLTSKPQAPFVSVQTIQCSIQITWRAPANNGGAAITNYRVEVCPASRRGNCADLRTFCARDVNIKTCTVPMSQLTNFGVASGEQIRVRAFAYNSNGWSAASAFNTGVVLMQSTAPAMQTPTAVKSRSTQNAQITLSWQPQGVIGQNNATGFRNTNTGYTYELWWNNGRTSNRGIEWTLLTETAGTTYATTTRIDPTREYFFKVRAKTRCGLGRFSGVRAVSYLTVPCQMEPPKTVSNGCSVNITWVAPCNGGTQILSYKIGVLVGTGNNARYVSLNNCARSAFGNNQFNNGFQNSNFNNAASVTGRSYSCTVPMTELAATGYNLVNGQKIIARAAACNQAGCAFDSPGTPTQFAATMQSRAASLTGLRIVNQGRGSVTFTHPVASGANSYEMHQCINGRCQRYGSVYTARDLPRTVRLNATGQMTYTFKVRSQNSCGWGAWSNLIPVSLTSVPSPMCLTATSNRCDVVLTWTRPANGGAPITAYSFEVLSNQNQWRTLNGLANQQCGKTVARVAGSTTETCKIPMTSLQVAPFYLRAGADIRVRAKACNKNGCGLPCRNSIRTIKLTGTPTALGRPRVKSRVGKQIVLEWDSLPNASFELWFRQDVGSAPDCAKDNTQLGCAKLITKRDPRIIRGTKATSYRLNNLITGNVYWFKIRAISANCGPGEFSQELQINMAVRPSQIPLKLEQVGCAIRATWEFNSDGGSAITSRQFEISRRQSNPKWQSANLPAECRNVKATSCLIPFSTLLAAPYSMPLQAFVAARIRVSNAIGASDWSYLANNTKDVIVFRVPAKMADPVVKKAANKKDLIITWKKMFSIAQTGGSDISEYELQWDSGNPNGFFKKLITTKSNTYTLKGLAQSKTYRFQVRAINACGYGPNSGSKNADLRQPPVQMASIKCASSTTECASVISWTQPASIGSSVEKYEITARGKDLKFYPVPQCNQPSNGLTLSTTCTVPMSQWTQKPFELPLGSDIYLRGRAKNAAGWSDVSINNVRGCRVRGKPQPMTILSKLGLPAVRSLDLTWPNTDRDAKFEIQWDKGNPNLRVKWPLQNGSGTGLFQNRASVYGLEEGKKYRFRISRQDICGKSDFSKIFTFTTAACPQRIKTAVVKLVGTNVEVTWEKPVTTASAPVLGYQVVFKKKNGSWVELENHCFGKNPTVISERKCTIPMLDEVATGGNGSITSLTGLVKGDLIQVMVRGFNKHCRSNEFSPENITGQTVVSCPDAMSLANFGTPDTTRNSIEVNWKDLNGNQTGGKGVNTQMFELQWDKVDPQTWPATQSFQTSNLSKSHNGLTNNAYYFYRIRAKNAFCWGGWSKALKVQTGSKPNIPDPPTTKIVKKKTSRRLAGTSTFVTEWEVQICWKMDSTASEKEVAKYQVNIETSNYSVSKENVALCDGADEKVIKDKCCRLPMSTFWSGEYKKDQGQYILAKVRAYNAKGWSNFSRKTIPVNDTARVEKVPNPMNNPYAQRDAAKNGIAVKWLKVGSVLDGGSPAVSYNLRYYSTPTRVQNTASLRNSDKWVDLVKETQGLEYVQVKKLAPSSYVYYQIRCRNRWGWGLYSEASYEVQTASAPSQIPMPTTTINPKNGQLKISWEQARDNGSSITGYEVQIKDKDGKWKANTDCTGSTKAPNNFKTNNQRIYCEVPMWKLWDKTQDHGTKKTVFDLPLNQVIRVKVMAINGAGNGPWSEMSKDSGARVKNKPGKMGMPTKQVTSSVSQFVINWKALKTDEAASGYSPILDYSLEESQVPEDPNEPWRHVFGRSFSGISGGVSSATTWTKKDAVANKSYKYKTRARNVYGIGPASEILVVTAGKAPDAPINLRSVNPKVGGAFDYQKVFISWDKPTGNGFPIISYKVQVMKLDNANQNSYFDYSSCTNPPATTAAPLKNDCMLDSAVLKSTYNYKPSDMLVYRVKACTKITCSVWSIPNSNTPGIVDTTF